MNIITFNFNDVPNGWAMCFNNECPMKDNCLRHLVAEQAADKAPKDHKTALCVTHLAYQDGDCELFAEIKTERMVWGFDHLYDHVLKIHFQDIKSSIVTLLKGISNYYRYRNGERMLSKAQQQKMAEIFRKYGYEQELTFDHYEDRLVFPF
ncbi:MAG: hypothetical protein IJJ68_02480 [Prevotella sp.]|nr:hypothetical protein [Prevotella sp.]